MYEKLVKELCELSHEFYLDDNNKYAEEKLKEAADAIEELLKVAKAMHTWIFLNSVDEQAVYNECGLSEEMNEALGYCGKFVVEQPKYTDNK